MRLGRPPQRSSVCLFLACLLAFPIPLPNRAYAAGETLGNDDGDGENVAGPAIGGSPKSSYSDLFTGTAKYGVSIAVLPGVDEMTPRLGLSYSSDASFKSSVGQLWTLGVPEITRRGKSKSIARFDGTDEFLLNGSELTQATDTNHYSYGNTDQFVTTDEQFVKIVRDTTTNNRWTVTSPDGTVSEFSVPVPRAGAAPTDFLNTRSWLPASVTNANGYSIKFIYTRGNAEPEDLAKDPSDGGDIYLSRILYTMGPQGLDSGRLVDFELEVRGPNNTAKMYGSGSEIEMDRRVAWIRAYADRGKTVPYMSYRLFYQANDVVEGATKWNSAESKLVRVESYGTNGSLFQRWVFEYTDRDKGWTLSTPDTTAFNALGYDFVEEFDDTFGRRWHRDRGVRFMHNDRNALLDLVQGESVKETSGGEWIHNRTMRRNTKIDVSTGAVVLGTQEPGPAMSFTSWLAYSETATDSGVSAIDIDGDGMDAIDGAASALYGNMNGDRCPDLIWSTICSTCTTKPVLINERCAGGTGFRTESWPSSNLGLPPASNSSPYPPRLVDVNGDGLTDLVFGWVDASRVYDGFGELCGSAVRNFYAQVYVNAGNRFRYDSMLSAELVQKQIAFNEKERVSWYNGYCYFGGTAGSYTHLKALTPILTDVNADNAADLVTNTDIYLYHQGRGYLRACPVGQRCTPPVDLTRPLTIWVGNAYTWVQQLNNGTHYVDLKGTGVPTVVHSLKRINGTSERSVYAPGSNPAKPSFPGLLSRVKPPTGGSISFDYMPSTWLPNGGGDQANPELASPKYVVTSVTLDDGYGNTLATNYKYEGGYFDPTDLEFRGFQKVEVRGPDGIRSVTLFHQAKPLAGRVASSETYGSDGNLYSMEKNYYTVNFADPPGDCDNNVNELDCSIPYLNAATRSENTVFQGTTPNAAQPSLTNRVDREIVKSVDGFITAVTTRAVGEPGITPLSEQRVSKVYLISNAADWIIGLRGEMSLFRGSDEATPILTRRFFYDDGSGAYNPPAGGGGYTLPFEPPVPPPNNSRITRTEVVGHLVDGADVYDNFTSTDTVYDPVYHHPLTAKNSRGQPIATITYDGGHIQPISVQNALGHTVNFTYDEYGRAKTTTDPNGIVSEVFYDPFQRAYRNTVSVGGVIQNESATDFLGLCDQACTTAPEADGSWATLKLPKNQRIRSKASQYRLQPAANWPWTETWFNALGQAYLKKSASKDNNGIDRVVIAETQFEAGTGRPWKASPAYQEGTPTPASNLWSVTSYDHIGRAYQVQYPSPTGEPLIHSVSQTVDPALHRIKTTSFGPMNVPGQPLHSKESYADVEGRVRKVVEYVENPEGVVEAHSVSYAYDFLGNVIQMIDDQGRYTTSAAFDAFDQKRKTVDDDMGEWTYSYDDLGNLVEQQDAMGNRTQLEYDDLGRVIHKSLISPSQVESYNTYAYDVDPINHTPIGASVGEILRVSNQNAALHYTYDELGRPTLVEQWIGSGNGIDNKIETGFIYNDAAPTLDIVYDAGSYRPEIVTYQFQERTGRLLGITSDLPGSNVLASNFVYDTLGKTQSLIHGNGLMSKFFYNLGDQQTLSRTRIDGPATLNSPKSNLLDYSYVEFDRNRNLINVIDDANGRDSRYVYDGLDRLKEADVQNLASGLSEIRNYEYDLMGRMTSMEGPYEPYGKPYAPVSVLPPPAPSPSPTPIVTPTPTPTPGGRGSGKGKIISGRMEKKWLLRIASWIADQILPSAQAITLQETLEASPNSEILANGQLCSQIKATVTDGSSLRVPIEGVNVNFSVSPTTGATWKTGCGSGSTLPISPVVPTNSQGVAIVYLHSTAAATKNVTGANATFNFSKTVPVSFVNITAPTNLTASGAGQTQIHLSWGPSTGVSGIAGYKIYRNGGATSVATVDLAATSYLDTGLSAGTTFTYAVKAYQSATTSNPSNTASAMTLPPTSLAMSYSGPGPVHALKSDGVYRHEYDLNGNLIATYDTRTVPETRIERLEYTPANMLERVTDVSGYSTEYEYDADNVRVRKVVKDAGGNIVEDRRFFGTTEMINGRKTRKYGIAQRDMDTGQVSFIHTDHLRSVVLVSDEQGNPVTRNEYYEFGAQKNPASEPVEDSFTGMKLDKATDYTATDRLHFNAREMAPKRFAFTTADTIIPRLTDPQSLNRYAYANNPINRIDPSGHNDIDLWAYYYGSPYDDTYFGGPLGPGMGSGGSYFGSDPFSGGYGGYDPGYRDSSGTYWTSPEAYNQAMQRSAVAARIAQIGEQIMRDPYFASTAFLNSSVPVMNALPAPSSPEITDERQVAEVRAFTGNDLNTTVWITEYINDNVTWRDSYDISPEMRSDDFNSALREKVGERLSSTLARLAESELKSAIKKGGQDILKDRIRNYAPDRLKDAEKTLRGLKAVDVTNSAIERKWEKSLTSFVSMVCPPCAKLLGRSFFVYHEAWEPSSKGVAATFETVFRNSPGSRYYDPVGPMELEK